MTLKDAARRLGVSWNLAKEIHLKYLSGKYEQPSLEGVENISIDEFSVKKRTFIQNNSSRSRYGSHPVCRQR